MSEATYAKTLLNKLLDEPPRPSHAEYGETEITHQARALEAWAPWLADRSGWFHPKT
jgi:hypothetical protein